MAVATYDRVFNFQNQQALTPAQPIPAQQLDSELNAVKIAVDAIISALEQIQRDDGALANESVGYDQLKPELSLGFAPPHVWATSNAYTTADAVFHGTSFYRCLVKHTAGVFATDLAAGKWQFVYDFATIFAQLGEEVALDGWSPEFALESDGEKRVLKIVDWVGGDGDKPAVGKYVGSSGLVDAIGDGADVRGPIGLTGDVLGWLSGAPDPDNGAGEDGEFYLQTGIGSTGVIGDVWEKAAGIWSIVGNIRGPAGSGDVSVSGIVTAGNFAAFIDGSTIEDTGYAPSDFAAAGHDHSGVYEPADANIVKSSASIADGAVVIGDGGGKGIKAHASGAPGTAAFANKSGQDAAVISGTAGTNGNLGQWNADGDLVDGPGIAATTDVRSFAADKVIESDTLLAAGASQTLSDASTVAFNMNSGWNAKVTIADNRTLGNPTNVKNDISGKIEVTASGGARDLALDTAWEDRSGEFPITVPSGTTTDVLYYTRSDGTPVIAAVLPEPA